MYIEMYIYYVLCNIFINILLFLEVYYYFFNYGKSVFNIEYIEIDDM